MASKKMRTKAAGRQPEVWVAPDLMQRLKGADGNRGVPVPQSPYLMLADEFLGVMPHESAASRHAHRSAPGHGAHKNRESEASAEAAPRAMAAAAGVAAGGSVTHGLLANVLPRVTYPKPPARPVVPHPPKLSASRPPARPSPPKLRAPKPPKLSFGYRRRKVDPAK